MRSLAAAWLTAVWMLLKQLWEPAGLTQRVPATAVWQMATNTTAEQRISIRLNRVGCMDALLKYSNDSEVCEPVRSTGRGFEMITLEVWQERGGLRLRASHTG